jgi:hypothetical protein
MKLPFCKSCLNNLEFPAPCCPTKLNQPVGKEKCGVPLCATTRTVQWHVSTHCYTQQTVVLDIWHATDTRFNGGVPRHVTITTRTLAQNW